MFLVMWLISLALAPTRPGFRAHALHCNLPLSADLQKRYQSVSNVCQGVSWPPRLHFTESGAEWLLSSPTYLRGGQACDWVQDLVDFTQNPFPSSLCDTVT